MILELQYPNKMNGIEIDYRKNEKHISTLENRVRGMEKKLQIDLNVLNTNRTDQSSAKKSAFAVSSHPYKQNSEPSE